MVGTTRLVLTLDCNTHAEFSTVMIFASLPCFPNCYIRHVATRKLVIATRGMLGIVDVLLAYSDRKSVV